MCKLNYGNRIDNLVHNEIISYRTEPHSKLDNDVREAHDQWPQLSFGKMFVDLAWKREMIWKKNKAESIRLFIFVLNKGNERRLVFVWENLHWIDFRRKSEIEDKS